MSVADQTVPARASAADWLAVVAGTLGALMALVDISIVNAVLPQIQGEIGATPSEGTWVGTAYLIAEIVSIPLVAWMQRLFGFRRLLLIATCGFTAFSMLCGLATSLEAMIIGRLGQGLAGGVLIPSAMTLAATRLPAAQQSGGLALVAVAALLGPICGPLLGGWLTENVSWNLIFFINVPICLCQVGMLLVAMDKEPGDWSELRDADWAGIAGIAVALGCLTTLLEEGQRERWFESALIWRLAFASAAGFVLVAYGQARARRPVLKLALLRDRQLAATVALMGVVGGLLFCTLFITPQFLAAIAGYNAVQSGEMAAVGGLSGLPSAAIYPLLVGRLGSRAVVLLAVGCVAVAAFLSGHLTVLATGAELIVPQLLFGAGSTLASIPLQQTAFASVSLDDAPEANSLMAVARNLGGSIGLAAIASFQVQRIEVHRWQMHAAIAANDGLAQARLAGSAGLFGGGDFGMTAAYRAIDGQVLAQALVMTFNDMFLVMAVLGVLVMPLALLVKPIASGSAPMGMH